MPGGYLESFRYGRSLLLYGSDVDQCPDGFTDKPADAVFQIDLDVSGVDAPPWITQAPLIMRDDGDFICRAIIATCGPAPFGGGGSLGFPFKFRFTDSESRYLQQQPMYFTLLAGTALNPAPLSPSVYYPAGSIAQFDVYPTSTAGSGTVQIILVGQRRYRGVR